MADAGEGAGRLLSGGSDQFGLSWRWAALIVAFGLTLYLSRLGQRTLTYHEVLFAQPAKEMLASGDWIIPRIAGVASTHKPPGTHWLIALSMGVFQSEAEWVVRLPSVAAAMITALLVAVLGARWFGQRTGVVAGLMQLTTYYSMQLGRLAEADMLLCAAVCGAMTCFAVANVEGPLPRVAARWPGRLFYLAAGLAFLAKGVIGPLFIFSGCGLYLIASGELGRLRFFLDPLGMAVFGGCVVSWPIAAVVSWPPFWQDQVMHNFGRYRGELGGGKPLLFYFYSIPLVLLPWVVPSAVELVRKWRVGELSRPFWQFAGCWFLPGFLVLSGSVFKSKHYPAPLLAPLAILAASGFVYSAAGRFKRPVWHRGWTSAAIAAGGATAVVVLARLEVPAAHLVAVLVGVGTVGILAAIVCEVWAAQRTHLAVVFGTVWLVGAGVLGGVMEHHDSYRDSTALAERTNRTLPEGAPVYLVQLPENQITYYLRGRRLLRFDAEDEFLRQVDGDAEQAQYVLAPRAVTEALAGYGRVEVLDRAAKVNHYLTERDRLTLVRFSPRVVAQGAADQRR